MEVKSTSSSMQREEKRSSGRLVAAVIWTIIKFLLIPAACLAALVVGLAIGYAVLGNRPMSDVFEIGTWKHMYDLVFAEGG
jgi:hypothetical protein